MNRTELLRRLAVLGRRYQPGPERIQVAINVVNVVPWTDSRCGTWQELDDIAGFTRSTAFYGRNLEHLNQLIEQYHQAEQQEGAAQ